jgi:hypothetical protein
VGGGVGGWGGEVRQTHPSLQDHPLCLILRGISRCQLVAAHSLFPCQHPPTRPHSPLGSPPWLPAPCSLLLLYAIKTQQGKEDGRGGKTLKSCSIMTAATFWSLLRSRTGGGRVSARWRRQQKEEREGELDEACHRKVFTIAIPSHDNIKPLTRCRHHLHHFRMPLQVETPRRRATTPQREPTSSP